MHRNLSTTVSAAAFGDKDRHFRRLGDIITTILQIFVIVFKRHGASRGFCAAARLLVLNCKSYRAANQLILFHCDGLTM